VNVATVPDALTSVPSFHHEPGDVRYDITNRLTDGVHSVHITTRNGLIGWRIDFLVNTAATTAAPPDVPLDYRENAVPV
jgi:hypothetical protein